MVAVTVKVQHAGHRQQGRYLLDKLLQNTQFMVAVTVKVVRYDTAHLVRENCGALLQEEVVILEGDHYEGHHEKNTT